jgi:hypothetical protein
MLHIRNYWKGDGLTYCSNEDVQRALFLGLLILTLFPCPIQPKGALITHQNMVSVMSAGLEGVILARKDDLYLSFLPLPHIFERIVVNSLLACGAAIGFYR